MSEATSAPDRFWRDFDPSIARSLSAEQRGEIERVVANTPPPPNKQLGDLRLSFKWFFLRFIWGPEKRSPERVAQERKLYSPTSRRSWKMLVTLVVGWVLLWIAILIASSYVLAFLLTA